MIRILQGDGGGARGIMDTVVVSGIECKTKKFAFDLFDLFSGTSTMSIALGLVAAGIPMDAINTMYKEQIKNIFKKRSWYASIAFPPLYSREAAIQIMKDAMKKYNVDPDIKMGQVKKSLMITSWNLDSGRTHFFKSYNKSDSETKLIDIISRSALSAVYYFGKINDNEYVWDEEDVWPPGPAEKKSGATWQDGGQGTQNCTLVECIIEAVRLGWHKKDKVKILSLGTGHQKNGMNHEESSKINVAENLKVYLGMARNESTYQQVRRGEAIEAIMEDQIEVFRLDPIIPEKIDKLDGKEYIKEYINYGTEMLKYVPWEWFL